MPSCECAFMVGMSMTFLSTASLASFHTMPSCSLSTCSAFPRSMNGMSFFLQTSRMPAFAAASMVSLPSMACSPTAMLPTPFSFRSDDALEQLRVRGHGLIWICRLYAAHLQQHAVLRIEIDATEEIDGFPQRLVHVVLYP